MKHLNRFLISTFIAIVTLLIVISIPTSAAERRIAGLSCAAAQSGTGANPGYPTYIRGTISDLFANTNILECPIGDDSVFPKWAVNRMIVHGRVTSTTPAKVDVRACSVFRVATSNQPDIVCGDMKTFTGTGNFSIGFDASDIEDAWGAQNVDSF